MRIPDFKEKLLHQLSKNIKDLMEGVAVDSTSLASHKKRLMEVAEFANETKIFMEDYEKGGVVKSFVVRGDTRPVKDQLKKLGGKWNPTLLGWVFPKTRQVEIAKFIKENS